MDRAIIHNLKVPKSFTHKTFYESVEVKLLLTKVETTLRHVKVKSI